MVRSSLDWILLNPSAATVTPLKQQQLPPRDTVATIITIDAGLNASAITSSTNGAATATTATNNKPTLPMSMSVATEHDMSDDAKSINASGSICESVFTRVVDAVSTTKRQLVALLSCIGDAIAAVFRPRDASSTSSTTTTTSKSSVVDDVGDHCEILIHGSTHHVVLDVDTDADSVTDSDSMSDSTSDSDARFDRAQDQVEVDEESNASMTAATAVISAQETARVASHTSAADKPEVEAEPLVALAYEPVPALVEPKPPTLTPTALPAKSNTKATKTTTMMTQLKPTTTMTPINTPAPKSNAPAPTTVAPTAISTPTSATTVRTTARAAVMNAATSTAAAFVAEAQTHTKTPLRLRIVKRGQHERRTRTTDTCTCTCTRPRCVDLPSLAPNSLLKQYVCECDECPFVSTITEHVALAYARGYFRLGRGTSDSNGTNDDTMLLTTTANSSNTDNDADNDAVAVADNDANTDASRALVESLLVWRILRALALYNEARTPRRTDVCVATRMLRHCGNVPERAFERLVASGCFDADVDAEVAARATVDN